MDTQKDTRDAQKKEYMRTQRKGNHPISKEQRPQKKPNLPTLELGLKASRMKRK